MLLPARRVRPPQLHRSRSPEPVCARTTRRARLPSRPAAHARSPSPMRRARHAPTRVRRARTMSKRPRSGARAATTVRTNGTRFPDVPHRSRPGPRRPAGQYRRRDRQRSRPRQQAHRPRGHPRRPQPGRPARRHAARDLQAPEKGLGVRQQLRITRGGEAPDFGKRASSARPSRLRSRAAVLVSRSRSGGRSSVADEWKLWRMLRRLTRPPRYHFPHSLAWLHLIQRHSLLSSFPRSASPERNGSSGRRFSTAKAGRPVAVRCARRSWIPLLRE